MKPSRPELSTQRSTTTGTAGVRFSLAKKIVFSLTAVVLAFTLIELGARLLSGAVPNAAWQLNCRILADGGVGDLEKILVPDPDRFWKLRSNLDDYPQSGQLKPFSAMRYSVSTDASGFRRTPIVHDAHRTILFLGDSCTFGLGVEDEETFPSQVQGAMGGVRCLNAGVPGYTAYQGRMLLERFEFGRTPDVVVITFGINEEMQWDGRGDLEHANMIKAGHARLLDRLRFVSLLRAILPTRVPDRSQATRPRLTDGEFEGQIRAMVRWCRARGAEPILVYWPKARQMLQAETTSKQLVLRKAASEEQVVFVDLVHAFRTHGGVKLFRDVVHANRAGCRQAAEGLLPALQMTLERSARPPAQPAGQGARPPQRL